MARRDIPTRAQCEEYCQRRSHDGVELYELGKYHIYYRVASGCFEIYEYQNGYLLFKYISCYFAWCMKKIREFVPDRILGE